MTKLYTKFLPYLTIALIVCISTFLLWLPFILKSGDWLGLKIFNSNMQYVYRNYDGPLYIIPAKTLYEPKAFEKVGLELPLGNNYFAAHLPVYPLLMRAVSGLTGYLKAQLVVNLIATILLGWFFFFMVSKLRLTKNPLILTTVLLFLPRFFVVRSVGAPESIFMLFILLSLFFYEKKKYLLAGLLGGLSVMTKTPGIILFVAYSLELFEQWLRTKKFNWSAWWGIMLIPAGLLVVFLLYFRQMGDFFAYFHTSAVVPLVTPYAAFNSLAKWVRSAWLEDIVFYFFIYALSLFYLRELKYRSFYYFSLVFFIAVLFVQHRDIARYSLPLWPLAAIAFQKLLTSRKFLLAFIVVLPAIYLYALNFILSNVMPVANWKPFL